MNRRWRYPVITRFRSYLVVRFVSEQQNWLKVSNIVFSTCFNLWNGMIQLMFAHSGEFFNHQLVVMSHQSPKTIPSFSMSHYMYIIYIYIHIILYPMIFTYTVDISGLQFPLCRSPRDLRRPMRRCWVNHLGFWTGGYDFRVVKIQLLVLS